VYWLNETHNPDTLSWVPSANDPQGDFPVQNLPFGVFREREPDARARVGVAIGDQVLDVAACHRDGLLQGRALVAGEACEAPTLNGLLALGPDYWTALRGRLSELLRTNHPDAAHHIDRVSRCLVPMGAVELCLPIAIGDYTDFYASLHHATNVGRMLRPENPLLPNYKHVPIGYHGRASSVVVSGTPIRRPWGQARPEGREAPIYGPSRRLDYELEVGLVIGTANPLGSPVPVADAGTHIFGVCLVNDWSARDLQQWEYQPLGPFLAKSFATTISAWVVTLEALEPYRIAPSPRPPDDPAPLPYLVDERDQRRGAIDLSLEVALETEAMRRRHEAPVVVSRSRFADLYWTPAQLVAHHTSNGCNLRAGDLLASGTVSGPARENRGCLLELAWRGTEPLVLPSGEQRRFLEDGDAVVFRGFCARDGAVRIGFGECAGVVLPATASPEER
jgi:fumarylacetoacetase